ncbi:hypothetical protein CSC2_34820 [Clostridium zeae]|uniref:Transcription initiation factor TFIIIB n=1 Tax=Clostridium zeae TaxID=2759022 RepID=A0ABQ1EDR1_9CLOT|nr:transcription initiation factor TFIIIB [Clostridium zeae]GFZ32956.1 hypothetical protein CSC2_34820 [Clostridium zeae]
MNNRNECPICGSKEISKGILGGSDVGARVMPIGKIFTMGSEIIVIMCTDCGHVLSMKVLEPKKFK